MENSKIIKIAVVGPESTGKSVLSEKLAHHFSTVFVPEFARDYFKNKSIEAHTLADIEFIYKKQMLLENNMIERANKVLFCDTNLVTGKVWADVVFNSVPQFIKDNIEIAHYDLHLLCDIDLPWVPDEQRRNKHNRTEIMQRHINELEKLNVKFELVSGMYDQRMKSALIAIDKHFKF